MAYLTNSTYILILAGLLAFVLRVLYQIFFSATRFIPGPFYSRFTTLPAKYYALTGRNAQHVHSLHQKYGPIVRVRPDLVYITDLTAIKEVYRIGTPFYKSAWYTEFTGRQPQGLFSTRDPHWHRERRAALASSLSENSLKRVDSTITRNIDKTISGVKNEYMQTGTADVFKWFTYMATDIIGELTFAESFRMLDQVKPNQYYHDLKSVATMSAVRAEFGGLTILLGLLQIKPFSDVLAVIKRLRGYAVQSIERYEKHVAASADDATPTLFTKLFTKEASGLLSRDSLTREGLGFIVAGSDTTAVTTTYTIYNICRYAEVRVKLLAELADLPKPFTSEDLRYLPYLNNVIQESLRLHGAVPSGLPRDVPATGALLAGYRLPAGIVVAAQPYSVHRDPKIFTQPETFNPDRWIDPTQEMKQAFMAFGAGTRICIGMHLARDEMRYAVASFFRRFPQAMCMETKESMEPWAYFLTAPQADRCLVQLGPDNEE